MLHPTQPGLSVHFIVSPSQEISIPRFVGLAHCRFHLPYISTTYLSSPNSMITYAIGKGSILASASQLARISLCSYSLLSRTKSTRLTQILFHQEWLAYSWLQVRTRLLLMADNARSIYDFKIKSNLFIRGKQSVWLTCTLTVLVIVLGDFQRFSHMSNLIQNLFLLARNVYSKVTLFLFNYPILLLWTK